MSDTDSTVPLPDLNAADTLHSFEFEPPNALCMVEVTG